jgi:hypothetical protein
MRVILRRTPVPDTLSWIIVLGLVPLLSTALYLLIGENRLGSRRVAKYESLTKLIDEPAAAHWYEEKASIDESNVQFKHLTVLASNVTGLPPLKGNALELLAMTSRAVTVTAIWNFISGSPTGRANGLRRHCVLPRSVGLRAVCWSILSEVPICSQVS